MAPLSIELSDAGIIAAGGIPTELLPVDGRSTTSPGFALQDHRRLKVGHAAAEKARLFPQQTINRFWDRLNTEPIRHTGFSAVSHAELAYKHLQRIWPAIQALGDEVVFSVPGFYSREQLGLLLGITQELNIDVRGFAPIALTAVNPTAEGEIIHIDVHLHRCEVTYLRHNGELVQIDTASVSDVGLESLYRTWTKTAAREFMQVTRFDLLHSAASEQEVYRHLPALLAALRDHQTVRFEMNTGEQNYHMPLQRQVMIDHARPVYTQIADLVAILIERNQLTGRPLAFQLSHRACGLPGLNDLLAAFTPSPIEELAFGAAALGAASCWPALTGQNAARGPARHTRRPLVQQHTGETTPTTNGNTRPTHLLVMSTAYPIGVDPLLIGSSPDAATGVLRFAGNQVSASHCSVFRQGDQVFLENHSEHGTHVDGLCVKGRTALAIGQIIVVGNPGTTLRLIECLSADTNNKKGPTFR